MQEKFPVCVAGFNFDFLYLFCENDNIINIGCYRELNLPVHAATLTYVGTNLRFLKNGIDWDEGDLIANTLV